MGLTLMDQRLGVDVLMGALPPTAPAGLLRDVLFYTRRMWGHVITTAKCARKRDADTIAGVLHLFAGFPIMRLALRRLVR